MVVWFTQSFELMAFVQWSAFVLVKHELRDRNPSNALARCFDRDYITFL